MLDVVPPNPRRPYDMHLLLDELVDGGSLLEIQARHGRSLITALARLGGRPVAVLANQPEVLAGAVDVAAAEKGARFVERAAASTCRSCSSPTTSGCSPAARPSGPDPARGGPAVRGPALGHGCRSCT